MASLTKITESKRANRNQKKIVKRNKKARLAAEKKKAAAK